MNIIDLNTLVKEDLIFKLLDGSEVRVPGQVTTHFVLELTKLQNDLDSVSTTEEQLNTLIDIVTLILQQDKNAGITREYVSENLSDINILKAILFGMIEHINTISDDENL